MIIHRNRKMSVHLILLLGVLALGTAQAQEVEVNSADPASAEQGTVNLDVSIAGKGFDNSAQVFFLITGTENPGGITVNSVKVRGSKKIIANIDVATDAATADFDVEVRLQSGRKGKGTTLFKVLQQNGNPGSGNQDEDGTAKFSGDLSGSLSGGFIGGDFETLSAQLTGGETLTVTGSAGEQLMTEDGGSPVGILPSGVGFLPDGCEDSPPCDSVVFNSASPTEWTVRLDHDKEPADRVQFRLSWHNEAGEQHFFRVGWITMLPDVPSEEDFGELTVSSPSNSLRDAEIEFVSDPYRIDGNLLKGKGKKTDQYIYVHYGDGYLATFDIATSVP